MNDIPALPPGFVIENAPPQGEAVPPLPPGFVLEGQPPGRKPRPGQSYVDWLTELDTYNRSHRASPGEFLNNIDAAVRATARGVPIIGPLADKLDPQPEKDARFAAEHPIANAALPILGGVASMAGLAGIVPRAFGITGPNLASRIGAGTVTGGAIGGVDAAIRSDSDPVTTAIGAGVGALTGGAMPAIGNKIGQWFGMRAARRAVPTGEQIGQAAEDAYRAADRAGLVIQPRSYQSFVYDLAQTAKNAGFNARLHPGIAAALDEAANGIGVAAKPTLRDMDLLRRVINSAGKSLANRDEGRLAGVLSDKLDEYLTRLAPGDIAAGDGNAAINAVMQARGLWSRMKKAEVVEGIFDRAKLAVGANYTSAGMSTALRQQFRALASSWTRNPKLKAQWTKEEQDAILRVVNGAPVENAMRLIGKFAPHGLLSTTLSGGVGYAAGGPLGAAATMGAGEFGKRMADASSRRAAGMVDMIVRSGGALSPVPQVAQPTSEAATRLLQSITLPTLPPLTTRGRVPVNQQARPAR